MAIMRKLFRKLILCVRGHLPMESKPTDMQNTNECNEKSHLPLVALLLNIIPFLLFLMGRDVIFLVLISIFPISGFIIGMVALCYGKKRIGTSGVVISIIAIAWPLIFIVTVLMLDSVGALAMNM